MTHPDIKALIDRVEACKGADREVDAALMELVGDQALFRGRMGWEWRAHGKGIWSRLPSPTASVDTALAVMGRALPVLYWSLRTFADVYEAVVSIDGHSFIETAETPALALLSALLKAIQSQGEEK